MNLRGCLFSVTLSVNAGYGPRRPDLSRSVFDGCAALTLRCPIGATTFLVGNPALWCPDFPLKVAKNSERRSSPKAKTCSRPELAAHYNREQKSENRGQKSECLFRPLTSVL